ARLEGDAGAASVRALDHEVMRREIEADQHEAIADRKGKRGEPARRYLQRGVPVMVREVREGEGELAHDLRPHVQRRVRIPPAVEREWRPRRGRNDLFNTPRRHRQDSSTASA